VPGRAVRLAPGDPALRVPNIGWCDVRVERAGTLFPADDTFYFAHSFHVECDDVAASIDYGGPVTAAIQRGNVFGVQFHPEKSQDAGLTVLSAFVEACA